MDAILGFIVFLLLVITGRSLWRREFKAAALSFSAIIGLAVADNVLQLTEPKTKRAEAVTKTATPVSETGQLSTSQEFVWIRSNQRLIAKKLKDPDSAKFENDFVSYRTGGPVVCGTVNAKNSFGAYSGAKRYIGAGKTIGAYMEGEAKDFDDLWRKVCG